MKNILRPIYYFFIHCFEYFKIQVILPLGLMDYYFIKKTLNKEWQTRINDVISCPDNLKIPRTKDAGSISKGKQMMHNNISILLGGYYGGSITQMLVQNKGVHEPQEEYVFQEVLKILPENNIILELGAYWSFYSMWFLKENKGGKAYLIEPETINLKYGKMNFKENGFKGSFFQYSIDEKSNQQEKKICIDEFIQSQSIPSIGILHADIQGYELKMLKGAQRSLKQHVFKYIFISTHSNDLHYDCIEYLKKYEYSIICESDLNNTFSFDGLIVAKSNLHPGLKEINISQKNV